MFNAGSDPADLLITPLLVGNGVTNVQKIPTASIPAWNAAYKGTVIFDTTTNKLKVAGAAAWETVTSA